MPFELAATFEPTGDQPQAIEKLVANVKHGKKHQVLLGVTGSGKTFTMANVIQKTQKPTLVIAHNKTLAAQLYQEFRDFFPNNAVSYFVSYYDYYQPEAYIPTTDTYIEKDSDINEEIDKLRLSATAHLMTRSDVIIIASVSCIYNLGSPAEYGRYVLELIEGEIISRQTLLLNLANLQYEQASAELTRGSFRVRGDRIQLWPAYEEKALNIDTLENKITKLDWIDPISGESLPDQEVFPGRAMRATVFPAKHYVINPQTQQESVAQIRHDLQERVAELKGTGHQLEAYRLEQKVNYDLEMIENLGFVNGIENYSRYFDGRQPGQPPFSLLDYFAENSRLFNTNGFLTLIDESHMTIPQIRGMYFGDQSRKQTLVEYGFRLPSAMDNRPLMFDEFLARNRQFIYVSATPDKWEVSQAEGEVIEQLIRPTGLIDPIIEVRPTAHQIEDLIIEVLKRKLRGERVLVTTLTKKMAEALTEYLNTREKVQELVTKFWAKHDADEASPNPDATILKGENWPVDSVEIGPIPPEYLTHAKADDLVKTELIMPKVAYLHSDIDTLERSDILADLRLGTYDVLVGINLLREGLDLPEVSLVAILDADQEGFLRSRTALTQTMGRAARHVEGRTILYADRLTNSMKIAISETQRRRQAQTQYNLDHGITPQGVSKPIRERMVEMQPEDENVTNQTKAHQGQLVHISKKEVLNLSQIEQDNLTPNDKRQIVAKLTRKMKQAANEMDFELAALIRDKLRELDTD